MSGSSREPAKATRDGRPIAWTIAGSDCGGGAGIQADLHTFHDFDVHACSVITALTAQNSHSLYAVNAVDAAVVRAQLEALATDLPAAVIKLGMLATREIVQAVAEFLGTYGGSVVCDPVLRASSGGSLLDDDAADIFFAALLPRVDLLTPNVPEAEQLSGVAIKSTQDIPKAAAQLLARGARSVLITGGHLVEAGNRCVDYWSNGVESLWLSGDRVDTAHTHGSGCTLAAAIAAALACGYPIKDALVLGKAYVSQGIRAARGLGAGPGPVAHLGFPSAVADLPALAYRWPLPRLSFPDCGGALGLYPVVDSAAWIERLLPLGATTIQLRAKNLQGDALRKEIATAVSLARKYGARLFINDHWQLAIECGAYGVHLGQEDLQSADLLAIADAGLRLGVSTHSWYEIACAHALAPSYIALGPVYATSTKAMAFAPLGLAQLQQWVDVLSPRYPLTAIGGISVARATDVAATGIGSIAVVTAITEAADPACAVASLQAVIAAERRTA